MVQKRKTEVCIVGAGPAGTGAALFLAKKGIKSIIVDKATFPRDKICGDALSGSVVMMLNRIDKSLVPRLAKDPIQLNSWGVDFIAPNKKVLSVPFIDIEKAQEEGEHAPGFISKREDFDNFLVEEIKKYDEIELIEGVSIVNHQYTDDGVLLSDKTGDFEVDAKMVLIADGAHSVLAKKMGGMSMDPKHNAAGLRAYYKGVTGMHEHNFIELHFLKDFLPGYFWIFPLPNGMANVGVGMRSDVVSKKKVNLKQRMFDCIENNPQIKERFKDAELVDSIKGFGLPMGSKKRSVSGDRYLLLGDAASLIDPFTGEGIGNALKSSQNAAEQVELCLKENNFSASFMKTYDTGIYRRMGKELKLSKIMQDLLNFPWLFNLVVNKAVSNKTLSETLSSMLTDIDVREQLKKPSFYFKVLFGR